MLPSSEDNFDKFIGSGRMQGPGTEDHPRSTSYWRYPRHSASYHASISEGINCLLEPSGGNINTTYYNPVSESTCTQASISNRSDSLISLAQMKTKAASLAAMVNDSYQPHYLII
jgi:hypothetical protein